MARPIRIEYPGAVYHVMARDNQGQAIYADDLDRQAWLQTLGQACEKTGWRVHAYVLMGNHHHLLVETPEANLVAGMKWLQATKGLAEKQVLAWWVRRRTTMGRRWISERLWMWEKSGVSRAVRLVEAGREANLKTLKHRLVVHAGGFKK